MLTGEAKRAYQREYMREYQKTHRSKQFRPSSEGVKTPSQVFRPNDELASKVQTGLNNPTGLNNVKTPTDVRPNVRPVNDLMSLPIYQPGVVQPGTSCRVYRFNSWQKMVAPKLQ